MIEGYLQDGTFAYRTGSGGYGNDISYTSHAHGWSTGPTYALSTYVLGIQLLSPGGATWTLAPQLGDLTSVEGGFTTNLGKFSAKWTLSTSGYGLQYNMPTATNGTLVLPAVSTPKITLDGNAYTMGVYNASSGLVTLGNQPGGSHTLLVSTSTSTDASGTSTTTADIKLKSSTSRIIPGLWSLLAVAAFFGVLL